MNSLALKTVLYIIAVAFFGPAVYAQDISISHERGDPAKSLAYPDKQNIPPMLIGSFLVSPKLALQQNYNTNIFATDDNEQDDFITSLKSSLKIQKFIRDHKMQLDLTSDIVRFWNTKNQNIENHKAQFDAQLVATKRARIPIRLQYKIDHRDRLKERSLLTADEPIRYTSARAETGFEYQPNRLKLGLYGAYQAKRFDNGQTLGGARFIREDGDSDLYSGKIKLSYQTRRNWAPFASFLVGQENFKRNIFDGSGFNGPKRDNRLVRALGGLQFDYKGLIDGVVAFGHDWRSYEDDRIDDTTTFASLANIQFKPTRGLNLAFDFSRVSEEDNVINTGIIETQGEAHADYELQNDLYLRGILGYRHSEFVSTEREDNDYSIGVGLNYILNDDFRLEGRMTYNTRNSTVRRANYDQGVFMMRLVKSF